jgi:hypothetical protein
MHLFPIFKIGIFNGWIFAACFFLISHSLMLIKRKTHKKLSNPPDIKLSRREKIIGYVASIITYISFLYSFY